MRKGPIKRISSGKPGAIANYFGSDPADPAILVDALAAWPALGKWSLSFFASNFGRDFGTIVSGFDASSGKATKLGTFIDNLDKPLSSIPGLWVGSDGRPCLSAPQYDDRDLWAFKWDPFRRHPELYGDISPYPPEIPNLIAHLDAGTLETLQTILRVDLFSIYITRANTITPVHRDFNHTIGSLVQFQSSKTVFLFRPLDYEQREGQPFDPETPDYGRFPRMRNAPAYCDVIRPGEMLIIPPDWWHYTRSHEHSLTLSHNFINHLNYRMFMDCLSEDLRRNPQKQALFETIRLSLECAVETQATARS